ncbi:odorant receptor 43b isoform X1 [Halyomorpha halys]|uniref:odorant receptor 43b isoform X1 n=1 Tax=Halyomorpha halys TaxID=286706 RepID=UPI000D0C7DC0|nr:odorant receptor 67c-like [Halyomorpha halys]KAE8573643.1 Odorant receptor 72 [Halyomorpha halys]
MAPERVMEKDLMDGLSIFFVKYLGFWGTVNTYRTSGKANFFFKVQWFLTFLCIPFPIFQFMSPAYIKFDLEKATIIMLNTLSFLQMTFKQVVYSMNLKEHAALLEVMTNDILRSLPEYKKPNAKRIFKRITKKCNFWCFIAVVIAFTAVSLWTMNPCISSEYIANHVGNMKDVTTGPKKILGGWYPIPFTRSPWEEIVYVYEFLLFFWVGYTVMIYELVITMEVMTLHAQVSVLNYHVSTLSKKEIVQYSDKKGLTQGEVEDLFYKELLAIIRDQEMLFGYGERLKNCFNGYITMLLATGGLLLIASIFQFLFGAKDAIVSINYMFYLLYEVAEFIFLCFATTMLETSSTNIAFSIYNSEWFTSDKRSRDTIQMIMIRSRKPMSLIAVKMYPVNVETLMSVFQFAYSASALISRMVE